MSRETCRHMWENNINMRLRETGPEFVNYIQMAQYMVIGDILWTWWWNFGSLKIRKSLNRFNYYQLFSEGLYHVVRLWDTVFEKSFASEFYSWCLHSQFEMYLIKILCCFVLKLLSLKFSVALVNDSVKYEDEED